MISGLKVPVGITQYTMSLPFNYQGLGMGQITCLLVDLKCLPFCFPLPLPPESFSLSLFPLSLEHTSQSLPS